MRKSEPASGLPWLEIRRVWLSGQVGLRRVVRWGKYVDKEDRRRVEEFFKQADRGCRVQESLQHSYSLTIAGMILVAEIDKYVGLDGDLLSRAFMIHDHGEGELKEDTLYIDKTDNGDLDEYLAFCRRYEQLDPVIFKRFEEAFLLQFAGRDRDIFSVRARSIMTRLRSRQPMEILAFEATERWDYLLYPLEQLEELGHAKVLVQVLRNQHHHLERLARELPGFGQEVWTREIAAWAGAFMQKHEGQWIEQKGEK